MTAHADAIWPPPGRVMTVADLDELPEDGRRYELIDGMLVASPSPTWARYATAGCPSYWVVDPKVPSVVSWDLRDGHDVEAGRAEGDVKLSLQRPYPIVVNPAQLITKMR